MSKLIRSDDDLLAAILEIQYISEIFEMENEEQFERFERR